MLIKLPFGQGYILDSLSLLYSHWLEQLKGPGLESSEGSVTRVPGSWARDPLAPGTCDQDKDTCPLHMLAGFHEQASPEDQVEAILPPPWTPPMTQPWNSRGIISAIFIVLPRFKEGTWRLSWWKSIEIMFEEGGVGWDIYWCSHRWLTH